MIIKVQHRSRFGAMSWEWSDTVPTEKKQPIVFLQHILNIIQMIQTGNSNNGLYLRDPLLVCNLEGNQVIIAQAVLILSPPRSNWDGLTMSYPSSTKPIPLTGCSDTDTTI